jgi:signal transduction histidine kinase
MTNFEPSNTPPSGRSDRLAWLRQLNTTLSTWAAGLSWWRMIALALIALIAGSWISEQLQLSHQTRREISKTRTTRLAVSSDGTVESSTSATCKQKRILVGGKTRILITEAGCKPAAGASADEAQAPIKIEVPPEDISVAGDNADEEVSMSTERTLGGWIGDILSALLVAFFAYLVAAKIIVRKTAESDAKLHVANAAAEREAMQRQLVQARLKLLQAQVEPHFLFNTLAAVDYLIETDPKRASEMQKLLISYLRAALPQMRQESSTLGRELALIRPYLELLKLRIEDRLSYAIQVPAGLESTVFPPMVLQTLVENAIKHGIEPKPEGGRVTVSAQVVDGRLCVDVADTGVGLQHGHIFAASTSGSGLGLDNIRSRLAMLYPGNSSLELRAGDPQGTVVSLSIPYQTEASAKNDPTK